MAGTNFFDFQKSVAFAGKKQPDAAGEVVTVSQLTGKIEKALKTGLPASIGVKGEVSNFKHHGASGHAYFTLKDTDSCIDCVMFKSDFSKLKFRPADGLELVVTGRVGVYGQRGRYQLYATAMQPVGQGSLELAFQQLRAKLEAEGLFEKARKRLLPKYPRHLILVTSKETAALQDMLKVLGHFTFVRISIFHVPVQGDGSAEQIAAAIDFINRQRTQLKADLIILGRGGGSLEDLWEFNEELVARAIVASVLPIITGIGHEVDVSIADLVADYHAHTPTEAAQVVISRWRQAGEMLHNFSLRLDGTVRGSLGMARQRLLQVERHELFRRPLDRVQRLGQRIDDREQKLARTIEARLHLLHRKVEDLTRRVEQNRPVEVISRFRRMLEEKQRELERKLRERLRRTRGRFERIEARLRERHPRHALTLFRQRLESVQTRLDVGTHRIAQQNRQNLNSLEAQLRLIGPEQVLQRGYSITLNKKTGQVLRSVEQVKPGEKILTRLADGQIESITEDANQPGLFE